MSKPKTSKKARYAMVRFCDLLPGTKFRDADGGKGRSYIKVFIPVEEQNDRKKGNSQRFVSAGGGGYRHFGPNVKVFATQREMDRAQDALVADVNSRHRKDQG